MVYRLLEANVNFIQFFFHECFPILRILMKIWVRLLQLFIHIKLLNFSASVSFLLCFMSFVSNFSQVLCLFMFSRITVFLSMS